MLCPKAVIAADMFLYTRNVDDIFYAVVYKELKNLLWRNARFMPILCFATVVILNVFFIVYASLSKRIGKYNNFVKYANALFCFSCLELVRKNVYSLSLGENTSVFLC